MLNTLVVIFRSRKLPRLWLYSLSCLSIVTTSADACGSDRDHDTQPYEIEASSLAEEYYGKNARLKEAGIPTYRSNPELQPKLLKKK